MDKPTITFSKLVDTLGEKLRSSAVVNACCIQQCERY